MAKIGKMIDDLTGKSEEEIRMKEQFSFLQKMASAKSETFENRLKLMLSNKETAGALEIVGDKAFEYHNSQHVNISQQCDDAITGAVDEFFKGGKGVKAGFQKLVKQGLSGLIGNTSIGETEEKMFFVFPENYSIVRVDVMAYKYTFSSKGVLANNVENVFVYTMAKSIVDHKKVGVDFLMHAVVDMLWGDSDEGPSLDQVMPFIQNLQMCWKLLDEGAVSASASDLLRGAAPTVDTSVKERIQKEVKALTPEDVLASAKKGAIA
ncbi:hypothetical protein GS424_010905 [Eggerthella guodeyinii]|uniref:Uncharacterized protein n=1 Tax=Eggerthella guodeyinii TaxID=2690837 RepID=A0A6L7IRS5_9ACTN|nr:hypothetical protein [Eggerthella guodeyinii]QOS67053.1 hypothetical protein GS424_010905 [Eggerthella guodeyinii]